MKFLYVYSDMDKMIQEVRLHKETPKRFYVDKCWATRYLQIINKEDKRIVYGRTFAEAKQAAIKHISCEIEDLEFQIGELTEYLEKLEDQSLPHKGGL